MGHYNMGLLDFFKAKPAPSRSTGTSPARADGEAAKTTVDLSPKFPAAVALAKRHNEERNAGDPWLLGETDEPEPELEDWQARDARHEAELGAYIQAMPHIEGLHFKTVYLQTLTALMKARTERVEANRREKHPESVEQDQVTESLVAAIERGEEAPSWALEALSRGHADGTAAIWTDEGNRIQVISEQQSTFQAWVDGLPVEHQPIASLLHHKGSSRGMGEAARQKVKEQPRPQPPATPVASLASRASTAQSITPATVLNKSSFWDHQVSPIKFLAGDLGKGSGYLLASGKVRIPGGNLDFAMSAVASVEPASEESVKRVGGAVGWGLAGAALFGPAGLIVGGLLGGKGKDVTFVGTLRDGKRFLATAKSDVYVKFQAASFR